MRVRPGLAFPWSLVPASSPLQIFLHNLWGPVQNEDVRSQVQKLRQWNHGIKPRVLSDCAVSTLTKLALLTSLFSFKHTSGIFLRKSTSWREARERLSPVCPIYNISTLPSLCLSKIVGKSTDRTRFHRGSILSVSPLGVLHACLFPMKVSREENHLCLTVYNSFVLTGGSEEHEA